ncbi:MAG: AAA family ATPase [Alphaproteobacteria bacterium]|nr:AAA family ATPase [Alphaproteobacteria bacterium]
MSSYFITGTDTDVGKTVASVWAMLHLDADYWKPVQAGLETPSDTKIVSPFTKYG